jgi:hypothetical protein
METSASFEARSAPLPYPTVGLPSIGLFISDHADPVSVAQGEVSAYRHPSTNVVTGTLNSAAVLRQLIPPSRIRTASSRRHTRFGRPQCLPLALAALTPATTRSRMLQFGECRHDVQ